MAYNGTKVRHNRKGLKKMAGKVLRLVVSAVASKLGVYSPRHGSNGCF